MINTFTYFEPEYLIDKNLIFLYFDFDAFFASVEELENPELVNQPLIVGNRFSRSVVSTCNYVARSYGIRSGMSILKALELCPNAIFAHSNFRNYRKHSKRIFSVIESTFSLKIDVLSVDEGVACFQNISFKKAFLIAKKIKNFVFQNLRIKISIGISDHFLIAKIFSNQAKPFGIKSCSVKDIKKKLWPLPITEIPGIGEKHIDLVFKNNFYKINDLAVCEDASLLKKVFGNFWESLKAVSLGKWYTDNNNQVKSRSFAVSETLEDLNYSNNQLNKKLTQIFDQLFIRLQLSSQVCKGIVVQLKSNDFIVNSHSNKMKKYSNDYRKLLSITKRLFNRLLINTEKNVRLIGISFFDLKKIDTDEGQKKSLFYQFIPKSISKLSEESSLDKLIFDINESFGFEIIKRANKLKS
ncbi:Y-family DNA polymerase [Mycoplasmoides genitalium]|uniref:Uncharacterized protein MG360 n=2 Tax=Mycoplasmoides genitalium TaxID=2097 RepID=Y360_MYCGE|nr:DNA polymerase IV [Mycoplasmoides genitalium]Q49426.1 RecName: Full=Uncharacterized protein MG360 [Mycoplasmoides genitalium G37]ABY79647.1 ImpB/MucB/SamB family protein [synthetic Mycoplasma genitalium JCVI-1.0]AAC71585.1 ImpB/MucB/SamB family protein [Mycoplasmoides genitalium G37]AFQ03688.1 ImpB/MucB/SamB family protein [Mycoplasmoides genitalium M6282]AFQ04195.1 ImpB/MucB/SamB family protein [Mycoplasmoides genitalium M6320]AFQ04698.1 ImpB/MucB/SamB family protein [Mycoplasmoides genit